jgi:hypothetical protein
MNQEFGGANENDWPGVRTKTLRTILRENQRMGGTELDQSNTGLHLCHHALGDRWGIRRYPIWMHFDQDRAPKKIYRKD